MISNFNILPDNESTATTYKRGAGSDVLDQSLRPKTFTDFIGQELVKKNLDIAISAAKKRSEPLDHVLLYGNPGLGKTTLAHIIAHELQVPIRTTSGPAIERVGDLASIVSSLEVGEVLFIDEIHRLQKTVEEALYMIMEDFVFDMILGKGPGAQTVRLDIPRFTLIGATTRVSLLAPPLRDRFGVSLKQEFYTTEELAEIVRRSAGRLGVTIAEDAAREIAQRSRFTPRVANRLLKRVRDHAHIADTQHITHDICMTAFGLLHIDPYGLDDVDRKILTTIHTDFSGGPVGVRTLCAAIAEDIQTLEEVYEPFLIRLGLLHRTPRGRIITDAGRRIVEQV